MEKFREQFGHYPKSVGCWLIDAPTLNYLAEKYDIGAATICKDQSGTDGYTLWGGYWNQAFYPSKTNAFMPAQTAAAQVKIPVFRMLGSDPVDQYDTGIGAKKQGVISLEPVYPQSGGNPRWVRWFFDVNFEAPCLTWAYAQAGQENSFGWPAMEEGLKDQYRKLAELRDQGRVRVETLGTTGEWFRHTFEQTPATAIVALADSEGRNRGSIWYENAHYRLNFFFDGDTWRIRDLHQFNENYPERYLETRVETNDAFYDTLPVLDGYTWSGTGGERAGIRLGSINAEGVVAPWKTGKPAVKEIGRDSLLVTLPILAGGEIALLCAPAGIEFKVSNTTELWALEMNWSSEKKTAVESVDVREIHYRHNHFAYTLALPDARATAQQNRILIQPEADTVTLNFK
jgi:hypothetical protein